MFRALIDEYQAVQAVDPTRGRHLADALSDLRIVIGQVEKERTGTLRVGNASLVPFAVTAGSQSRTIATHRQ